MAEAKNHQAESLCMECQCPVSNGNLFCCPDCKLRWKASEKRKLGRVAHYTQGPIECIDAIQSALTPEEFRGFCKGNALKYLWRERHKGGPEDLQKAGDYLRRLVEEKANV